MANHAETTNNQCEYDPEDDGSFPCDNEGNNVVQIDGGGEQLLVCDSHKEYAEDIAHHNYLEDVEDTGYMAEGREVLLESNVQDMEDTNNTQEGDMKEETPETTTSHVLPTLPTQEEGLSIPVTFRQTNGGTWCVMGPTTQVSVGEVVVTKKDGSTTTKNILHLGKSFTKDGVEQVYGYFTEPESNTNNNKKEKVMTTPNGEVTERRLASGKVVFVDSKGKVFNTKPSSTPSEERTIPVTLFSVWVKSSDTGGKAKRTFVVPLTHNEGVEYFAMDDKAQASYVRELVSLF